MSACLCDESGGYFEEAGVNLNVSFYEVYSSSPTIVRVIKSRRIRWAGHVARMVEGTGAYRVLVGKPEGKRPLERPRLRWEDNIKEDLYEVGCGDNGLD
jgi:hypothetical protein